LISAGFGRRRISRLFSSSHSSAMMSLQSSMHSSQMYTVGPAMSFRTSFWLLPQNEHFSTPLVSRVRAMDASYPAEAPAMAPAASATARGVGLEEMTSSTIP